jgi:hypothetical protein
MAAATAEAPSIKREGYRAIVGLDRTDAAFEALRTGQETQQAEIAGRPWVAAARIGRPGRGRPPDARHQTPSSAT